MHPGHQPKCDDYDFINVQIAKRCRYMRTKTFFPVSPSRVNPCSGLSSFTDTLVGIVEPGLICTALRREAAAE